MEKGICTQRRKKHIHVAITLTLIGIMIVVLVIVNMPRINRNRTLRRLLGEWVEYSDSEYLTTIAFTQNRVFFRGQRFSASVYEVLRREGDRAHSVGTLSGAPWWHNPAFTGDLDETHFAHRGGGWGVFSICENNQLTLYFSMDPHGREVYRRQTVDFSFEDGLLLLTGTQGTVAFVRQRW